MDATTTSVFGVTVAVFAVVLAVGGVFCEVAGGIGDTCTKFKVFDVLGETKGCGMTEVAGGDFS